MNKQESIFDLAERTDFTSGEAAFTSSKELKVYHLAYEDVNYYHWQDLFQGYERLYAVTYSSSIDFVSRLIPMFAQVEIIFGSERVLSSFEDIMAYQEASIDELRTAFGKKDKKILDRIDDGSLALYLMRDRTSHKKMYLMEGGGKPARIVTGSANLSNAAFGGVQLENIYIIEGSEAYDVFYEEYAQLKGISSDSIAKPALVLEQAELLEQLPISMATKAQKVIAVNLQTEDRQSQNFLIKQDNLKGKYKKILPQKKGKNLIISTDDFVTVKRRLIDYKIKKKEAERISPSLKVDILSRQVVFNGVPLDLTPEQADITNDISWYIRYMDGFRNFLGDVEDTMNRYYAFTIWMFISPFMSIIRREANYHNKQTTPYPLFGLLYGESNAGKTNFLETIITMMTGIRVTLPAKEFVKSSMDPLRIQMAGFPIMIDDVKNDRFRTHAIELIKDDYFIEENASAIVISANKDVKVVQAELSKRMVTCKISSTLPKIEAMKSSLPRNTKKNIGTAFYRAFMARFLDLMDDIMEELADDDMDAPDVFALGSQIFIDLVEEFYGEERPSWIRKLNLEYYFITMVEQNIKEKIIRMWETNPAIFKLDKRANIISIDVQNYHEANNLATEIPPHIQISQSGGVISLHLDKLEEYLPYRFKGRFRFTRFSF